MAPRRVALTGFPGWLTRALLGDLANHPERQIEELVLLTHHSQANDARTLAGSYPYKRDFVPFELGGASVQAALTGVDTLIHSAAVIHVRRTRDWYDVNTRGTIALAKDARTAGVRRFVYISSIAAAGRSRPDRNLVESDEPRPLHHYGRSKLLAEGALLAMQKPGTFEVVILRPSMFYGPPVPDRHIDVYRRILHGRMPLVGGGKYNRSVVHIENLVQATWLAAEVPRAAGQTYFVVDRQVYTTLAIVEAMAEALGTKPRYLHIPEIAARSAYEVDRALSMLQLYVAPVHLVGESHWHQGASCEKAIRELGYAPKVELLEGMRRAIEWCRINAKL